MSSVLTLLGRVVYAVGLVMVVPFAIIAVGLPVVLVARVVMAAATWFGAGG